MVFKKGFLIWIGLAGLLFYPACFNSGGEGVLVMAVKNATRPASLSAELILPEPLRVKTFRVVVTGEGMSAIEAVFSGDSRGGTISGIPVGDDRKVLIEALNSAGIVIRRRKLSGIKIGKGNPTPVVATLLSVPFVTSPSDGNLVTQTRLIFKGYGEPGGSIEVVDISESDSAVLSDLGTSLESVSPSLSDGGFVFRPPALAVGPHTFVVRDPGTGEESQVTVTLVRPGRLPGVTISAAGLKNNTSGHTLGTNGLVAEVMEQLSRQSEEP